MLFLILLFFPGLGFADCYYEEVRNLGSLSPWSDIAVPAQKKWEELSAEETELDTNRVDPGRLKEVRKAMLRILPLASSTLLLEEPKTAINFFRNEPRKYLQMQKFLLEHGELLARKKQLGLDRDCATNPTK